MGDAGCGKHADCVVESLMGNHVENRSELRLIGNTDATRALGNEIDIAARADARVLITGETGVGKDVIARLIHQRSARRLAPLATVNCAGLTDTLIESELFGHVRGSFTDAYRDKPGILESAPNGTVFLDEIGEMSPRMQGALLRFLETGEIQRVGGTTAMARANVRIIAATNRDLHAAVAAGTFRQDLLYRLDVIHIAVQPLRERREDIPAFLEYFLEHYAAHHRKPARAWSQDAIDRLSAYSWPGNVRQLRNVVERVVLRSAGTRVGIDDLPGDLRGTGRPAPTAAAHAAADGPPAVHHLLGRMLEDGESFWMAVYAPFMNRDLRRADLKAILAEGLERTGGSYRLLVRLFNMPDSDYKRFLNSLRTYGCHLPYRTFRVEAGTARSIRVA
jgi:two-component system, NtrC family, response regulator HydG